MDDTLVVPARLVTGWNAKRAGARITITGFDEDGRAMKVVGVDRIEAGTPHPIATDRDGDRWALA